MLGKKLTEDQRTAADEIRSTWDAFNRLFAMGSRDLETAGTSSGPRARFPQPISVMNDAELDLWEKWYRPWYESARKRRQMGTTHAQIVLDILNRNFPPEALDKVYRVKRGTCLKVLKQELDEYKTPNGMSGDDKGDKDNV